MPFTWLVVLLLKLLLTPRLYCQVHNNNTDTTIVRALVVDEIFVLFLSSRFISSCSDDILCIHYVQEL